MSDTTTVQRIKARLSCNHTVAVPAGQPEGATVSCEKCPARKTGDAPVRRIKRLLDPVPAWGSVPDMTHGGPHRPNPVIITETETDEAVLVSGVLPDGTVINRQVEEVSAEAPKASEDRAERLDLARAEHAAVKAWRDAGQHGEKPATPNLDALNAANAAGLTSKQRSKAARNPRPTRAAGHQYWRRGTAICRSNNNMAGLAWQATAGLGTAGDKNRLTVAQLRALLADRYGVTDPDNTEFQVTLDNGVEITATITPEA